MYDTIVIGGGHNGLTCGAYLARSGKSVVVLDRLPHIGGMAFTQEMDGAPGYFASPCAVDFDFFTMPHSVTDELELHKYGMRLAIPDPWGCQINAEGESLAFWRSLPRTAQEIAHFSRRDAERYVELTEMLTDFVKVALPYLQGHPRHPGARTVGEIVWRAVKARRSLAKTARILAASPVQILEEWFEREEVKAPLAVLASLSMLPLDAPGSNFGLLFGPFMHSWGLRRGVGGTGAFTRALAACITAHGGTVRASAPVERVLTRGDRACGVVLDSGEELFASDVVAAVDPMTLLKDLIHESHVPQAARDELRAASIYGHNVSHFKVEVAISETPTLRGQTRERSDELMQGVLLSASSLTAAHRSVGDYAHGDLSAEDPVMIVWPSAADRTLVPPGSEGQVLYLWGVCPFELRDGEWPDTKGPLTDKWIELCDSYAPGLKDVVVATETQAPDDFITKYGAKGHLYHADLVPSQLGPWRPLPSLAGYHTPVPRLWHTGAGAHPMPGVNGYSGRSAAREVLRAAR